MLIKMGITNKLARWKTTFYQGDIVQVWAKKLKDCSN